MCRCSVSSHTVHLVTPPQCRAASSGFKVNLETLGGPCSNFRLEPIMRSIFLALKDEGYFLAHCVCVCVYTSQCMCSSGALSARGRASLSAW